MYVHTVYYFHGQEMSNENFNPLAAFSKGLEVYLYVPYFLNACFSYQPLVNYENAVIFNK
jgi:hypothetical protein